MIVTVIPARLGSSRLPDKLILRESGRPLLYHTIDRVMESALTGLIFVLTPDEMIEDLVKNYGDPRVQVVRTGQSRSGSERAAKFVSTYFVENDHTIVNFQGDEPELSGSYIDRLAYMAESGFCDVATLVTKIKDRDEAASPDVVKVVLDHSDNVLWFSRHAIPSGGPWHKHIGIYAYKASFLRKTLTMQPTTAPEECLEQLQWLQSGYRIRALVDDVQSVGIDTYADYSRFVSKCKGHYANQVQ